MRPAGYLGRTYAERQGGALGLPGRLADWTDMHALRALLANGGDMVGNLLPGDVARDRFLAVTLPAPMAMAQKAERYAALAHAAANGQQPGFSAGGEQPKFVAHAATLAGPRHVLVKSSEPGGVDAEQEPWQFVGAARSARRAAHDDARAPGASAGVALEEERGGAGQVLAAEEGLDRYRGEEDGLDLHALAPVRRTSEVTAVVRHARDAGQSSISGKSTHLNK